MKLNQVINCPECRAALADGWLNQPNLLACPSCRTDIMVEPSPALGRSSSGSSTVELATLADEAVCFHHPQKKAVLACEGCGRFVCALCDCDLNGRHYCPNCLETGKKKGKIRDLQTSRRMHDSVALAVAVFPMLVCYLTIITAPVVLYLVFRHWKSPGSILPRTKIRFVLAGVLAVLQLIGAAYFLLNLFFPNSHHG